MKVIKVKNCSRCPYVWDFKGDNLKCTKERENGGYKPIGKGKNDIPEWCPLDDAMLTG